MPPPEGIDSLDKVRLWIAHHSGQNDAFWDAQHLWNRETDKLLAGFAVRLSSVEKRMAVVAAVAALVGGLLGTVLTTLV